MAKNKEEAKSVKKYKVKREEPQREEKVNKPKNEKSMPKITIFAKIVPYALMTLAVILALFFIIARAFNYEEGVGVVGGALQDWLCGIFGFAAFLLPVMIFHIGLRWCLFNIKCSKLCEKNENDVDEAIGARRFARIQTVTSVLFVFFVSTIVAVISDGHESFVIADMWNNAVNNLVGGGVAGGIIGYAFSAGIGDIPSIICLAVLLAVSVIFMIGLTPDRIVDMIQTKRIEKKERRAAEAAEQLRLAAEAEAEARKHKNRMAMAQKKEPEESVVSTKIEKNEPQDEEYSEPVLQPINFDSVYAAPSNKQEDVYISIDGKVVSLAEEESPDEKVGEDFGGDPVFDAAEFKGIQSVLDGLGVVKPEVKQPEPAIVEESDDVDMPDEELDEIDELRGTNEPEHINLGHLKNEELINEFAAVAAEEGAQEVEIVTPYVFPPIDMLTKNPNAAEEDYSEELQENAQILMETLKSFKVSIRDISYSRGPTITRYELRPEAGTRVRAIANLVDDIALNLATTGVRIEAPIPNKPAVGIEVPNRTRATVYLRDLIESPKFLEAKSRLTACLGMDVGGNPIIFDVSKMPHLLIAGATGMGKSVCINTIIVSMLYKAKPDELKLILIDPKKVEFTMYKHIPHLYAPIVSDPKKAAGALASAVAEMERRFEMIEDVGVRDIAGYNAVTENDPEREFMPQMVIIIDELADLMMTAPDEVESSICRLAQKARAAGIHIIIGTQRPSVDVITGLLKANIPSRIACTVASQVDSRTILDIAGAEKLIGRGDMLFAPVGASKPMRVQGAFVSESEVEQIVTFIRDNNAAGKFNAEFIHMIDEKAASVGMGKKGAQGGAMEPMADAGDGGDSKFDQAVILAIEEGKISTSLMQRRLGVGYGRAAKIIDEMEERGYVSKPDGNKPRRVLISMEEYQRRKMENDVYDEDEE